MVNQLATITTSALDPALPADQNPAYVYLAKLAPGSRRTMAGALNLIASLLTSGQCHAGTLPWQTLRYQHAQAVRSALLQRYSPATTNKHIAALRGVLKECWRLGLMPAEDYHRAVDLDAVRGSTLLKGRALTPGEVRALSEACAQDTTAAGARDAALLAVLYAAGLRRDEAVALSLDDYNPTTGELVIQHGKGHKARNLYATNGAADALAAWLEVRGAAPGPFLCPVNKGGTLIHTTKPMTSQAVLYILRKRATEANVAPFEPHDLRRTWIGDLLEAGVDISTVARMAGHANVNTTARYDRRPEEAKRRAADLLHFPYVRRTAG